MCAGELEGSTCMTAAMSELAVARATPHQRGEPRQGPGALREATSRQHVSTAGDRVFERSRTEGPA